MTLLSCQKAEFSIPEGSHYFNNAYVAPLPNTSVEAGKKALLEHQFPTYSASAFFDPAEKLREKFARLIGSPAPDRIALIPSASYGFANAAANISLHAGQEILILEDQFPSNVYIWKRKAVDSGAKLRVVKAPPIGPERGKKWNDSILTAINANTAVVSICHVHWTDGTRFNLEAISKKAKQYGALLLLDATQSMGAMPFDFDAVEPDAVICAGYKWLLGPYNTGLAYYGSRFDKGLPIEESWITRKGSDDFQHVANYVEERRPKGLRYSAGEHSSLILLPVLSTSLDLLLEWESSRIQNYCKNIRKNFDDQSRNMGCWIEDEEYRGSHLSGVYLPEGWDLSYMKAHLAQRNIYVSLRGRALRVAINIYNTEEDLAVLLAAMKAFQ